MMVNVVWDYEEKGSPRAYYHIWPVSPRGETLLPEHIRLCAPHTVENDRRVVAIVAELEEMA